MDKPRAVAIIRTDSNKGQAIAVPEQRSGLSRVFPAFDRLAKKAIAAHKERAKRAEARRLVFECIASMKWMREDPEVIRHFAALIPAENGETIYVRDVAAKVISLAAENGINLLPGVYELAKVANERDGCISGNVATALALTWKMCDAEQRKTMKGAVPNIEYLHLLYHVNNGNENAWWQHVDGTEIYRLILQMRYGHPTVSKE